MKNNIYKSLLLNRNMKRVGGFLGCIFNEPIVFYNDISCINLIGVTQLGSSFGLSGNRTHTSYFGDTRATTTLLAH